MSGLLVGDRILLKEYKATQTTTKTDAGAATREKAQSSTRGLGV